VSRILGGCTRKEAADTVFEKNYRTNSILKISAKPFKDSKTKNPIPNGMRFFQED
jgi:hypothetical protein